jgi:Ran GTPase-activating protein (RanGAP) involved in mRNA processing and transport
MNGVGPKGGVALGEALEVNKSLSELRMYTNNIGSDGAQAIAKAIKVHPELSFVEMRANGLEETDRADLRKAWGRRKGTLSV